MTLSGEEWDSPRYILRGGYINQVNSVDINGDPIGYAPFSGITQYESGNIFSYTFLGVELSPTLLAIGWFMKFSGIPSQFRFNSGMVLSCTSSRLIGYTSI